MYANERYTKITSIFSFSSFIRSNSGSVRVSSSVFSQYLDTPLFKSSQERVISQSTDIFEVHTTLFTYCRGYKGGAIYCEAINVSVTDNQFYRTNANIGGAVYFMTSQFINFSRCVIDECVASNSVSAFILDAPAFKDSVYNVSHINISSCVSVSATIECWGGFPVLSTINIFNCSSTLFYPHVRTSTGPKFPPGREAQLKNVHFQNNSSYDHGACYMTFGDKTHAVITQCYFIKNTCQRKNVQLYNIFSKMSIKVVNCVFACDQKDAFYSRKAFNTVYSIDNTTVFDPSLDLIPSFIPLKLPQFTS